ncbi:glycosyltransferase [Oenococcus sicerae]|uniref:Glycosyltransferase n=1 Tax=Oenococcus sicerae TaxID=2203724 RepID=A0AAJ1RA01_9LACO|nr:glycosyltransferase [Oenococcus sicerae]MDN6899960.1 glycosyltransferase [Oenococcus sicerae]QAS69577.1 glycosyltransferase [Oenococcus sicerae]
MTKKFSYANLIVTFNRKEKLVKAINFILDQDVAPKYIVVVDNNSSDGTNEYLQSEGLLANKKIKYFKLDENIGGSGGFEYALEQAKKLNVDWIAFGDDDAYYQPGFFHAIAQASQNNPDVKAFTGTVKLNDGRTDITHRIHIKDWGMLRYSHIPLSAYAEDFPIDMFTFVGSVVNKEILSKIGEINAKYFIWMDDLEFSVRVREQTNIINVVNAVVIHDTSSSAMDFKTDYKPDWRHYYGVRNKIDMCDKHGKSFRRKLYPIATWIKSVYVLPLPRFKGHRKYEVRQVTDAVRDAKHNHFGKNPKYLPGSN